MFSLGYRVRHGEEIEEKTLDIDDKLQRTNLKLRQIDKILVRHDFSLIEQKEIPESILALIYQNKKRQRVYVHQKWYGPHCSVAERLFVHGSIDALYTNVIYISTSSYPPKEVPRINLLNL